MRLSRRAFAGLSAFAALSVATFPGRLLAASTDALAAVDPELRKLAADIMQAVTPDMSDAELLAFFQSPDPGGAPALRADVPYSARRIPGPKGAPDITVFVVNSKPGVLRPAILHMHAGGFCSSSAKDFLRAMQDVAMAVDAVTVTVEYRLAPGTPFPGPVEDCYAALLWLQGNAESLGVDPRRIAVMGEDAGGTLATLVAIAARDRGQVPLAFQLLDSAMLDDRTGNSRKVPAHLGRIFLTPGMNRFAWRSFLGHAPGTAGLAAQAVPARHTNLAGLPPTFIGCPGLDILVLENIDYAEQLTRAGVPTELVVVPGAFHVFDGIDPQKNVAKRYIALKMAALKRGLKTETTYG